MLAIGILKHLGIQLRYVKACESTHPTDMSAKGLAPTLIIARVAAGHARPDYSWTSAAQTLSECLQFASATVVDSDADCESRACRSEDIESLASFEMNRGWSRI